LTKTDLTVLLYQEINIQAIVIYGLGSAEIRFVQLVILVNRVIDRNDAIALVAFYQKGPKYITKFGKTGKIKGNLRRK
jgi:hypothetical protein